MPALIPRAAFAISLALPLTLAATTLLPTAPALAQGSINDCEKIQAADAYNQCLAKFGPEQKTQNLAPERPGDVKNSAEEAAAGAGRPSLSPRTSFRARGGRHGGARRAHGGRKRIVFTVRRRR